MSVENSEDKRMASPGTVEARSLSTLLMGNGEGEPLDVIANQILMHYVGIGWISLRAATEEDYRRFPTVVWEDSHRK